MDMLRVENLCVEIGGAEILRDVSVRVPVNSFAALVGRNGAGKTTFMRSVLNLLPAASGSIAIAGDITTAAPAHSHAARGVGYMPEGRRLVPAWTVEQNILLPAWALNMRNAHKKLQEIYALMPEVEQFAGRKALALSGGQQKLVALARALMVARTLLVLDEPFEGVAPALVQRLAEILSDLKTNTSLSVIIAESDGAHVSELVDSVISIERGRVVN